MDETEHIRDAGKDLASYAEGLSELEARSRSEILFPYIFCASKKLSSRAISRWFSGNKGIEFSAASVAKVIRECDRYFALIADRVQPLAEHVSGQFGGNAEELLFQPYGMDQIEERVDRIRPDDDSYDYTLEMLGKINEEWFELDEEIRFRCRPFFDFETGKAEKYEA